MIRTDDRLDLTRRRRRQRREEQQQQQQQQQSVPATAAAPTSAYFPSTASSIPVDVDAYYPQTTTQREETETTLTRRSQSAPKSRRPEPMSPVETYPITEMNGTSCSPGSATGMERTKAQAQSDPRRRRHLVGSSSTNHNDAPTSTVRYTTPTHVQRVSILKPPVSASPRNPDVRRVPSQWSGEDQVVYYHREAGVGFRPTGSNTNLNNNHIASTEQEPQTTTTPSTTKMDQLPTRHQRTASPRQHAARYYASRITKDQQQQQQHHQQQHHHHQQQQPQGIEEATTTKRLRQQQQQQHRQPQHHRPSLISPLISSSACGTDQCLPGVDDAASEENAERIVRSPPSSSSSLQRRRTGSSSIPKHHQSASSYSIQYQANNCNHKSSNTATTMTMTTDEGARHFISNHPPMSTTKHSSSVSSSAVATPSVFNNTSYTTRPISTTTTTASSTLTAYTTSIPSGSWTTDATTDHFHQDDSEYHWTNMTTSLLDEAITESSFSLKTNSRNNDQDDDDDNDETSPTSVLSSHRRTFSDGVARSTNTKLDDYDLDSNDGGHRLPVRAQNAAMAFDEIADDMQRRKSQDLKQQQQQRTVHQRFLFDTTFDNDDDDDATPIASMDDDPPESKYARAIQYLAQQDTTIQMLQQQLHDTKLAMVQCQQKLQNFQSQASHEREIANRNHFQERIDWEEKLRHSIKRNQDNEAQIVLLKRRLEHLEKEKQLQLEQHQKATTNAAEQWNAKIEQLQEQVGELRREKQSAQSCLEEMTIARATAESNASMLARDMEVAKAEIERWKKIGIEADMLRTQLSAVRAVLGESITTTNGNTVPANAGAVVPIIVNDGGDDVAENIHANNGNATRDSPSLGHEPTKNGDMLLSGSFVIKKTESPTILNALASVPITAGSNKEFEESTILRRSQQSEDGRKPEDRGVESIPTDEEINIHPYARSRTSSWDSRASRERQKEYIQRNEDIRINADRTFDAQTIHHQSTRPLISNEEARQANERHMQLSTDPSFDAQGSHNGSGGDQQSDQLNLNSNNDTEDDEMQELIQQLNSMKETLSRSHSSDPLDPPMVRRQHSVNAILGDGDETPHQYISFEDGFWLDNPHKT